MPLVSLLNNPFDSEEALEYMWFSHFQHHIDILQAIKSQLGVSLTQYPIYPVNKENLQQVLQSHQQYHDDMNGVLGLNGVDLQSVNLEDKKEQRVWTDLNFREHQAASVALTI